jgi:hypothetical protein
MRKMFMLIVISACFMTGCSIMGMGGSQSIVGTWEGSSPQGFDIVLTFRDDMTVTTHMKSDRGDFKATGTYKVDFGEDPATLDILGLSIPDAGSIDFLSIIDLVSRDSMRVDGAMSRSGDRGVRPTVFSDEAIKYTRVK